MQGIVLVYKDNITYILLLRSHPAFSGFSFTFDLTGIFLRYFILHFFFLLFARFPQEFTYVPVASLAMHSHAENHPNLYLQSRFFSFFFPEAGSKCRG